jgi:hypothetical protein
MKPPKIPARKTANTVATSSTQTNAKIPRINPAIAIPLESSFLSPIAPKMIAIIGKIIPTKGIGIAQAQHNPIIPKINAIIPFVFDIFSPLNS